MFTGFRLVSVAACMSAVLFAFAPQTALAIAPIVTFSGTGNCTVDGSPEGITKTMNDLGPCTLNFENTPVNTIHNPPIETVFNNSGVDWHGFHFEAITSDLEIISIVDLTNTFVEVGGDDKSKWFKAIDADLPHGGSVMWQMVLRDISDPGITNFSIRQTATVPEPGTLALLAFGLAGLGVARRRAS